MSERENWHEMLQREITGVPALDVAPPRAPAAVEMIGSVLVLRRSCVAS